jgi:hypothetical protein
MLMPSAEKASNRSFLDAKLLLVLLTALIVCILLYTHTSGIDGPWYWKWPWRYNPWRRYWIMLPAALPFVAAQWLGARWRTIAICLLVLCTFQLRLTYTLLQDSHESLGWLTASVRDPVIVSYYSDASAIGQDPHWLADYPQILPMTSLHTQSKPPGPVLYYLTWIRFLGYGDRSAKAAGLTLIALKSLVVPLVYLLARSLTADPDAAFAATSFYSLCSGALFMTPMLDPLYAGFTCLILWSWDRSLWRNNIVFSAACGASLAAAAFCTYTVLTLAPFATIQVLLIARPARPGTVLPRLLLGAIAGFIGFYVVLWACTFFDPIATFQSALRDQQKLVAAHIAERPWPTTILFDLTDFALAMGWVGAIIPISGILRPGDRSNPTRIRWLLVACAVQPLCVAILGILQSETFRVWNFMLPLTAIAAGVELTHWTPQRRATAYAAMFIVMLVLGQNLRV